MIDRMIIGMLLAVRLMGDAYAEAEPAEITIHLRGQYKAEISALLLAADGGTTRTGIAELDSLAASYGLMGIYHKSGFYGYQFRLTFPPGADGAAIAGAYRNVSYIQAVVGEAEKLPVLLGHRTANGLRSFDMENPRFRLLAKVGAGTALGSIVTAVVANRVANVDNYMGGHILAGLVFGCSVGFPLGVSMVDPYDSLLITLLGGVIPLSAGSYLVGQEIEIIRVLGATAILVGPIIGSLYASEKWRQPPQARRVSFALSPTLNGGLSAVTTLYF